MVSERAQLLITAVDQTRAALNSVRSNLETVIATGSRLNGILSGLGIAFSLDALLQAGKAALDTADELSKLSQKTGIAVESLSLLRPIAEQAGVPLESLAKGLHQLSTVLVDIAHGAKEPAEAFNQLGVSVVNSSGQLRPTEDVLLELADAFAVLPDSAEKAALAVKIFGKSGVELIPFFNQGSAGIEELKQKFKALGLEVSGNTARAAEALNDSLDTVKQALSGVATQVATAALPTVQSFADALVAVASQGEVVTVILRTLAEVLVSALAVRGAAAIAGLSVTVAGLQALFMRLWPVLVAVGVWEAGRGLLNLSNMIREADQSLEDLQRQRERIQLISTALDELANTGVVSLETHLKLAAQAAERLATTLPATATALRGIEGAAQQVKAALQQALQAETQKATEAVKQVTGSYKQLATDIKASLDARLAGIEAHYQRQNSLAQSAGRSEAASIRQSAQLLASTEREKMRAVEASARQTEGIWQKAYAAVEALARRSGQDTLALEREALSARINVYGQMETAYRSTIDRLIAEEQRHLAAAKSADEARLNLRLSVEDRIRELSRKGMDEYAAYQDRLRQIDEKQQQARTALAAGNFEQARKLAEDAIALAEQSASGVTRQVEQHGKTITQTLVSEGTAASNAIAQIRESAGIADTALKGLGNAHRQAASAATSGANEAQRALTGVTGVLEQLRAQLQQQDALKLNLDIDATQTSLAKIQALTEAQQLIATLQLDTKTAEAGLEQFKSDTANLTLVSQVETDISRVLTDIDQVRTRLAGAQIEIPTLVSFDQPREQLQTYVRDAQVVLSAPTEATHAVRPDLSQYRAAVSELQKPTSSTHTVYVQEVTTKALGGLIQRFAEGGQALRQAFTRVTGRVSGPGTDTSDSIPALLSNGEFVIRAASVRRFGEGFFAALNAGFMPPMPRLAMGGAVTEAITRASRFDQSTATANASDREIVDINFNLAGKTHRVESSRDTAMQLAQALRELSRGQ